MSNQHTIIDYKHNDIYNEIRDMREELSKFDIFLVKKYIKDNLKDDVEKLKELYHQEFKNIDDKNNIKLETIRLLGEMGIYVNDAIKINN